MMMKKSISLLIITVLLVAVNSSLSAQEQTVACKLFYAEFSGPGVFMSVNFDSRFKSNSRLGFGYRIGVGYGVEKFEDKFVEALKDDEFAPYFFTGIHLILPPLRSSADIIGGAARSLYTVPIGLNYILGKPNRASNFEVGAGVTLLSRKVSLYNYQLEKQGNMIGYLNLMYRLTPIKGGLSLRVGITPIIGTAGDFFPTGAVCLGYAF